MKAEPSSPSWQKPGFDPSVRSGAGSPASSGVQPAVAPGGEEAGASASAPAPVSRAGALDVVDESVAGAAGAPSGVESSARLASSTSHLPYYLVFFLAGVPALVYQVTWQRVLGLYFGVDIYSTSVTVSTFMLGLGAGSLVGGELADRSRRPDLLYAVCEALLALCGVASLSLIRSVGEAFAGASLLPLTLASGGLLLVPTLLMGMTLPLMVRTLIARDTSEFGRQVAWLYGVNTLGAAVGALLTAYLVIGVAGLHGATWIAAGLNLLLALAIVGLGRKRARTESSLASDRGAAAGVGAAAGPSDAAGNDGSPAVEARSASVGDSATSTVSISTKRVLALSALSGAVALGYEVVWYRLLKLLLHGTAYVFGTILGILLLGMGLGSLLARRTIERKGPAVRFGHAQLAMAAYSCLTLTLLGRGSNLPGIKHLIAASSFISFHPAPELAAGDFSLVSVYSLLDTVFWPAFMIGLPAVAMGYGFPHLVRAAPQVGGRYGRSLGGLYAANILGATLGSLLVGFLLLEHMGSERTFVLLMAVSVGSAALAGSFRGLSGNRLLLCAVAVLAGLVVFPWKGELVQALHLARTDSVEFSGREDKTGIVALRKQNEVIAFGEEKRLLGQERLYIDGARHGGVGHDDPKHAFDRDLQVALASRESLPRALSIGLGDGMMVATAIDSPVVEDVVVVELSGGLREVLATTSQSRFIRPSPQLQYVNDDGRRWLLAHPDERFDLIMTWPLHAAHAFSGNLYSAEFYEIVRRHLSPNGIFFTRTADGFSTARTLADGFPYVVRIGRAGYVAAMEPLQFSAERAGTTTAKLVSKLQADRSTIETFAGAAPVVHDFSPRTEYYLSYPWAGFLGMRRSGVELYRSPAPLTQLVTP